MSKKLLSLSLNTFINQVRHIQKPRRRYPVWYPNRHRVVHDDYMTQDNKEFLKEYVDEYNQTLIKNNSVRENPLTAQQDQRVEWDKSCKRTGLIVKKLGNYPLWFKDGKITLTTLLQVADNHVVKYTPPEEYQPMRPRPTLLKRKDGCLLVGADTIDPSYVTKEYHGLFSKHGVPTKKELFRFYISDNAKLPSGTPLFATHFRVGDYVDILGKTIDRGFQGVMKRWGFKGMPATHGVTKTHRRPGNIGGGGEKGRVWPGTKLPGHMGNRWRITKGVQILRINPANNVLWVRGVAIPGETGAYCYMYDTILPNKRHTTAPPFPTWYGDEDTPEDIFHDSLHIFNSPTILYDED